MRRGLALTCNATDRRHTHGGKEGSFLGSSSELLLHSKDAVLSIARSSGPAAPTVRPSRKLHSTHSRKAVQRLQSFHGTPGMLQDRDDREPQRQQVRNLLPFATAKSP